MKVIIMAAGRGTRMQPLTENTPKPLLMLNDKTILDYTISQLPDKVDEIIIVVGYLKEKVIKYVKGQYPDSKIKFVVQEELYGTGHAVYSCKDLVTGRFMVLNGDDLYFKQDLEKLLDYDLAFLVKDVEGYDSYGYFGRVSGIVELDKDQNLLDIVEKKVETGSTNITIGAYVLNQEFFNYELVQIHNQEYGLPQTIVSMAKDGKKIKIIKADFWYPVGYPKDLENARKILKVE